MFWEKRKDKNGKSYYSFIQWDQTLGRNIRLRKSEVPQDIATDSAANAFCKLREAEFEATKMRILRKLEWQKKFYDFDELLDIHLNEMKNRAPNSWNCSMYYLKQYVFDFFLNHKQCNNLNNWPLYYEEFRDWLLVTKTSKKTTGHTLAYNSRNNIIGALNTFMDVMCIKNKCQQSRKCSKFPSHLSGKKSAEHVITDAEARFIEQRLRHVDPSGTSANFFAVLLATGMRLGEGLSLSVADFFPCAPTNKIIAGALDRHNIKCIGYISLESQLANTMKVRNKDNHVPRKPLKGRRAIDASSNRIIPIANKKTYNLIAMLYNQQLDSLDKKAYGTNKGDYLLFDGLNKNKFSRHLRLAYKGTSYKVKSPHCTRHTFATSFAGQTDADVALCRLVLGHRDEDTTMGYVHIFEQINRQARSNELVRGRIELLE